MFYFQFQALSDLTKKNQQNFTCLIICKQPLTACWYTTISCTLPLGSLSGSQSPEGTLCSFTAFTSHSLGCECCATNACHMKVKWPLASWHLFPVSLNPDCSLKQSLHSFHPHETFLSCQMSSFISIKDASPSYMRICFSKLFYYHCYSNGFDIKAHTTRNAFPLPPPCSNLLKWYRPTFWCMFFLSLPPTHTEIWGHLIFFYACIYGHISFPN